MVRVTMALAFAFAFAVGIGAPASGGGWAVGSLDAAPEAIADRTADVSFTILQHGVTPIDLTDDVGVEIVGSDGTVEFFAARGTGVTGQYGASVTFPSAAGEYAWQLRMGWFGRQDLGTIDVTSADAVSAGAIFWPTAKWVMLTLTFALAVLALWNGAVVHRRAAQALAP